MKNLAARAGDATGELEAQVLKIRSAIDDVVISIEGIGTTVRRVNDLSLMADRMRAEAHKFLNAIRTG